MWKIINKIFGRKSNQDIKNELSGPNDDANDRLGIDNILHDFFSNVGEKHNVEMSRMNNNSYKNFSSDHNRFFSYLLIVNNLNT